MQSKAKKGKVNTQTTGGCSSRIDIIGSTSQGGKLAKDLNATNKQPGSRYASTKGSSKQKDIWAGKFTHVTKVKLARCGKHANDAGFNHNTSRTATSEMPKLLERNNCGQICSISRYERLQNSTIEQTQYRDNDRLVVDTVLYQNNTPERDSSATRQGGDTDGNQTPQQRLFSNICGKESIGRSQVSPRPQEVKQQRCQATVQNADTGSSEGVSAMSPMVFTKILRTVVAVLHKQAADVSPYIDDWLIRVRRNRNSSSQ